MTAAGIEKILEGICALLMAELPRFIAQVNEAHGDGIEIGGLYAAGILGGRFRTLPYATLGFCGAELSEKDRVIDCAVYAVEIEIHICERKRDAERRKLRYMEALGLLFAEYEFCDLWERARVTAFTADKMTVRVEC